jgi:hypothetical protein
MKPIKRVFFMGLGSNFEIYQLRKQIFINFDEIILFLFTFFFAKTLKISCFINKI